jgi:RNA polymerase sigma factor (sigma-70 family)
MISGSIEWENNRRLSILHTKHHNWLMAVAYKLTEDKDQSSDLVGDLYVYLAEKCNPKLYYLDSFNLMYLHSFIKSRFYNNCKRNSKQVNTQFFGDIEDTEYDVQADERFETAYWQVMSELNEMKATNKWASGKLFELYHFSDKTLDEVALDIGISKSTLFLNCKRVKTQLKTRIKNPFSEE